MNYLIPCHIKVTGFLSALDCFHTKKKKKVTSKEEMVKLYLKSTIKVLQYPKTNKKVHKK